MPESKFWRGIESKSLSLYGAVTPHLRGPTPVQNTSVPESDQDAAPLESVCTLDGEMPLDKPQNQGYKPRTLLGKLQSGWSHKLQSRLTLGKREMLIPKLQAGSKHFLSPLPPSEWETSMFLPLVSVVCLSHDMQSTSLLSNVPFRHVLWSVRTKIARKRLASYLLYRQSRNVTEKLNSFQTPTHYCNLLARSQIHNHKAVPGDLYEEWKQEDTDQRHQAVG